MERRFLFQQDMDLDPGDLNAIGLFAQTSLEHIVGDGITAERKYAGFAAAATGITQITLQPGRIYAGGKVYNRETVFNHDFTVQLPLAAKKIVSIVGFGTEIDTATRAREFLIDEATGASEPREVATEVSRVANVNVVAGQENADPLPPVLDAGIIVIAQVLLGPAGILSVTNVAENALDSVASVNTRVQSLESFAAAARPQIVALGSDIASLKSGISRTVDQDSLGRVLVRVATLESKNGIPSNASSSAADYFLDLSLSDAAFAGYSARVEEGIRFATAASADSELAIFNALNPAATIRNGYLFPAYNREVRLRSGPRQGEIQASSYGFQVHSMVERTVSRQRLRYGYSYTYSPSVVWWNLNSYDYWTRTFGFNGEVFNIAAARLGYAYRRQPYYWYDTVEEHYWDRVTIDRNVPGTQVAETFLNANDMWLDAVGLTFTKLAADGAVTLCVTETDRGLPDLAKVISYTVVDRANLALNAETVIPVQPVFLSGGKRYAILIITAADHWLATTNGENFPGGTLFYVLDGAYQQGDATKDLCFSLHAAKFRASRAVIDLQPLQLAGGITEVDVLAGGVVPGATDLTYEVQVNNVWVPLAQANDVAVNAGGAMPAILPLRAVFTGTPDVMPVIKTTGSRVRVARPLLAFTHVSGQRVLPGAGSAQIRVITRLESFNAANHTHTIKLRTGAGFATVVAASSVTDTLAEDGAIDRTAVFNLGAAVTAYRIQLEGTTNSALSVFNIGSRKDYAL